MSNRLDHLRILPTGPLNYYLQKRYNDLPWVHKFGLDHIKVKGDFLLIHAWKPGYVKLTREQASHFKAAIEKGENPEDKLPKLPEAWLVDGEDEPDVEGLLAKVIVPELFELLSPENLKEDVTSPQSIRLRAILEQVAEHVPVFPAIQNPYELRRFLEVVKRQKPKTVVEIGTASGGVFYCLSQLADPEALLVSIDYPGGPYGGGQDDNEVKLYSSFGSAKQQFSFIRDRSFHCSTKQDLKKVLGNRQIDLLFIDGDHSYGGVSSDFRMYQELVAPGGMIAFHDISMRPETWGRGYDVGVFWDEVKQSYPSFQEFVDPTGCREPFIRHPQEGLFAYGIGTIIQM
ncbi:class I SAM-dependent methyltransferase [Paenibacillus polymyxa]|uniref:class I SAM-dependent methyltransferase n=1 Tax=Paenibacillus polymyxa TaxID=1406 RepID=UPI001F0FCA68|nr:class I SAM-dependent methyltransferase [Paenibacillus polymyxa]UMR36903.1 class I SAM-dependent methyltransferase [Paenibacillus polymyxa]